MGRPIVVEAPALRVDPQRLAQPFAWAEVFGSTGPVEIEVGIGKGRFLLAAAAARPDVLHLGVEWANKYLRVAESRALKRGLENVRFARLDARELVRAAPDASVAAYYVFYPDPWPKKRHQKRRFLQPETLGHLARTLAPHGLLHVTTDHAGYWAAIEPLCDEHPELERLPRFGAGEPHLGDGAPLTNFEEKYRREGRVRYQATWRRRAPRTAPGSGH
jgi:tRNA (guanine-N7-)-methyltransferase